ncbi:hypothetical protein [Vibrio pectenicida]|uniref:Uncharacterized protein n=1 Tax=Vibrio pectenicida TaxID=62763 RepID=A0A427U1C9_9VIBR|nr:hypothetical protein [Vibrio pectenicida]RSD30462.1 hypothetical protein EJA03_13780 [Vibrio pectenicida]
MTDNKHRLSQVQKEILLRLRSGFIRGITEAKSTSLNHAVNVMLDKAVHPNNFRLSCRTLENQGLIMRRKYEFDWYLNITPEGFELTNVWLEQETAG